MPRTIIHVDLDAFYCAIEEQRDPSLRGRAFAVGGQPDQRGVVASCSYPARRAGVRSAMPMARALTLCPNLIVVPSRHAQYRAASQRVMNILRALTPQVEQLSIDEAFLDVSALVQPDIERRSGRAIALYLQRRILRELGLSCSVGVASNKMVAKIATDFGKSTVITGTSPHAICVVPPGREAEFLAPLSVSALWGVGPKTEAQLATLGITTIGQIAQRSPAELMRRFGRHGYDLAQHSRGIDKRELVTTREAKSISSETTFTRDVEDWDILIATLQEQAAEVVRDLRGHHLQAATVKIKLRWSDFTTPTRQMTLASPTDNEKIITEAATELLYQLWQSGQPVRLLGVGVSGLHAIQQLSLWGAVEPAASPPQGQSTPARDSNAEMLSLQEKRKRLQQAVAFIQERYGERVLQCGTGTDKSSAD